MKQNSLMLYSDYLQCLICVFDIIFFFICNRTPGKKKKKKCWGRVCDQGWLKRSLVRALPKGCQGIFWMPISSGRCPEKMQDEFIKTALFFFFFSFFLGTTRSNLFYISTPNLEILAKTLWKTWVQIHFKYVQSYLSFVWITECKVLKGWSL